MNKLRSLIFVAVTAAFPLMASAQQLPDPLVDAARKAVVSNPEVQARWNAFRAADAERDVARGGYLPQVDVLAGIGQERLREPGQAAESYTHRGATLSLNQMVYDGFYTRNQVSRLGYARLTRYYEVMEASESAALEAVRAYADVQRYRELVALAQSNYVEHKQVYDQIAERAAAGVGRRVDFEQAAGRLALAESNLLTEASNLHDVSARYLRIVGEVPANPLAAFPEALSRSLQPATVGDALTVALNSSPSMNAVIESVRAGQAEVDSRRAANHPRVDFRARQSIDHNLDGVDGRSRAGVVELVLSYNLFRGGADQARIRQAAEELNVSRDLREKVCRDLRQTLTIAYNDVHRLQEQLRYLDQHQLSIEKARQAYRAQFDIGQRTLLDLLDTENEYFQARRAYVNARYDQGIAQARSLAGMGRLLPAMQIVRDGLPTPEELGQDRSGIDPADLCPALAPIPQAIDKEALFAEAMKAAGK